MKTTKWYPVLVFSILTFFLLPSINLLFADHYPDQFFVLQGDSLYATIESSSGIRLSHDGRSLVLDDNATSGYAILTAAYSEFPFNRGLPSWNGSVADESSGFMIQMRFAYGNGWSPWLTAGFWKAYIWASHGSTSYGDGEIDYDYVKLSSYQQGWQFKIMMQRNSTAQPSPTLSKLSFFISDSRTTAEADYTAILNDNPAAIMIPTDFFYQYAIDDQIGGSICSPTTVSMILRSYEIPVDPLQFARDTRDPYYGIFGIWPRVVQNASEYGLDGAVTRYRSWSEAREVLAKGGRIGMSVSYPLYSGHLMMLAGFSDDGTPLVHDPARKDGYAYRFNKSDLSHSWFDKGGIGYTFYLRDSVAVPIDRGLETASLPHDFQLYQNYPNPFNPSTTISFDLPAEKNVALEVYDLTGRKIRSLANGSYQAGNHQVVWDGTNDRGNPVASGIYIYRLVTGDYIQSRKMILMK